MLAASYQITTLASALLAGYTMGQAQTVRGHADKGINLADRKVEFDSSSGEMFVLVPQKDKPGICRKIPLIHSRRK